MPLLPERLIEWKVVGGSGRPRRRAGRRTTYDRASAGRNEDSVKAVGFWHFFVSRNPRNLRQGSSSLVSTSLTHSGDDEDSEDSGIISLFFAGISGIFPQKPDPKRLCPALDRVHACTGGWFTSAWWNLNPGGWRRWPQAERCHPLMGLSKIVNWFVMFFKRT